MEPPPTNLEPSQHRQQRVLMACGVLLALLMAYRAYSPQWQTSPSRLITQTNHTLDPNTASEAELSQLPGVGPKYAKAIVAHREQNGPFTTTEQLTQVKGVGPKTVEKLKPYLVESNPEIVELQRKPLPQATPSVGGKIGPGEKPIDVNKATAEELQRLPGIGPTIAARIIEERKLKPFITVDDLKRVKGIGTKILENIRAYVAIKSE